MLFFLLLLAFCTSSAFCAIQITIPGQIYATSTIVANYTRDPSDPIPHKMVKVKEDTDSGSPLVSPHIKFPDHEVNKSSDGLSGNVQIPFNRAGIFHLEVQDDQGSTIARSISFGVNPPMTFQVAAAQQVVAGPDDKSASDVSPNSSSSTDSPSNSSSSSGSPPPPSASVITSQNQTSTNNGDGGKPKGKGDGKGKSKSSHSVMSPGLIAGTVILSIFLLVAIGGIVFYFMRKRLRRQRYLKERREIESTMMNGGGLSRNGSATATFATAAPFGVDMEKGAMLDEAPSARRFSIFTSSRSSFLSGSAEDTRNGRRRSFPSIIVGDTGTISTIQFNPQTERQIALEERIWELEAEMNRLRNEIKDETDPPTDNELRLWKLKGQIETLRNFKHSAWALGQTDDVPAGLVLG